MQVSKLIQGPHVLKMTWRGLRAWLGVETGLIKEIGGIIHSFALRLPLLERSLLLVNCMMVQNRPLAI